MRRNHILNGDIVDVITCGFCGQNSCNNTIRETSRKAYRNFIIQSTYKYFIEMRRKPKLSVHNKCTNYVKCSQCGINMWTYNAEMHYKEIHNDIDCPVFVTEEEKNGMLP